MIEIPDMNRQELLEVVAKPYKDIIDSMIASSKLEGGDKAVIDLIALKLPISIYAFQYIKEYYQSLGIYSEVNYRESSMVLSITF